MKEEEQLYRLALCFIDLVGPVVSRALVDHCGSAEAVFNEKTHVLQRIPRVGGERLKAIRAKDVLIRAEKELAFIESEKIDVVFFQDERYPRRLLHCPDAPVLLFIKGKVDLNPDHTVSVVGTRRQSNYGRKATEQLIQDWARYGPMIVSGLALGVDTTAHKTAIKFDCPTIAVLGHGIDRLYPHQNRSLAITLQNNGALVSEFPSGTNPDAMNFPKRNRIVAGISDATVVIEAAEKGGALITGQLASGYQRDVFALPGRVNDPMSKGCLNLIKNNEAHVITQPSDVPELLGWDAEHKEEVRQIQMPIDLSTEEAAVISTLGRNRMEIDRISIESGMTISQLYAVLTALELRGIVRGLPGKQYEVN